MERPFNSSALSKQIGQALKLDQESELKLYKELSQLADGEIKKALNALTGSGAFKKKYAACIKGTYVRNAQYMKEDTEHGSSWFDSYGEPLFLGIVEAETYADAKRIAALRNDVTESVIELHPLQ